MVFQHIHAFQCVPFVPIVYCVGHQGKAAASIEPVHPSDVPVSG